MGDDAGISTNMSMMSLGKVSGGGGGGSLETF